MFLDCTADVLVRHDPDQIDSWDIPLSLKILFHLVVYLYLHVEVIGSIVYRIDLHGRVIAGDSEVEAVDIVEDSVLVQ
jgi:hypothetical protein